MQCTFRRIGRNLFLGILCAVVFAGCRPKGAGVVTSTDQFVPAPIDLLLPKTLEIHSFTQTENFGPAGSGIHARVKALDAYGDATKAFGQFRFELYAFRPQSQSNRGTRLADWEVDLSLPEQNLEHWDRYTGSYEFKLGWPGRIPTGQKLILLTFFDSPFTPRLTAERDIVAGE